MKMNLCNLRQADKQAACRYRLHQQPPGTATLGGGQWLCRLLRQVITLFQIGIGEKIHLLTCSPASR
jgi:hypothetical protein